MGYSDIVSLGKSRSQSYLATLPRLKSRVRIPSPAPENCQIHIILKLQGTIEGHFIYQNNSIPQFFKKTLSLTLLPDLNF